MNRVDPYAQMLTYAEMLGEDAAHVRLKLDTDEPIALSDFVGSFVGIGNQFDKFVTAEHPGVRMESEFFVKEVRAGCVEADLLAVVMPMMAANALPGIIDGIDKAQILQKFVQDLGSAITPYFSIGGRNPKATKSDLNDFLKAVGGIARDPAASAYLEAAEFVDGKRKVTARLSFTSEQARQAQREITDHKAELESTSDADHKRVLLQFVRPSVEIGKPGKPGGERGIILKVHHRPLPIFYASDLAEQQLKFELQQGQGNVFRKLFDVDVNVEMTATGKPRAYRIVALHDVVDPSDDEEDGE